MPDRIPPSVELVTVKIRAPTRAIAINLGLNGQKYQLPLYSVYMGEGREVFVYVWIDRSFIAGKEK